MSINTKSNSRFGPTWLAVLGLIAVLHSSPAQAYPALGQDIYYHGGALRIEILPYAAAYTSQIYLHAGGGMIFLANSSNIGTVIDISDPASLGLNPEDEFVLGIHVINTGDDFVMGAGYDNPDGVVHALVNYGYNQTAVIVFEDLRGGGDLDYDDAVVRVAGNLGEVRVAGNLGVGQIPEPASMLLFGAGLIGAVYYSRRH